MTGQVLKVKPRTPPHYERGYVHGDIRLINIVFNEGRSYLIDFDLARAEGDSYPSGYQPFPVRHPEAVEEWVMKKQHDRWSLGELIRRTAGAKIDKISKIIGDLNAGVV